MLWLRCITYHVDFKLFLKTEDSYESRKVPEQNFFKWNIGVCLRLSGSVHAKHNLHAKVFEYILNYGIYFIIRGILNNISISMFGTI